MEGSGESILFIWVLPRSFLVLDLLGDVEGISTSVGVLELRRLGSWIMWVSLEVCCPA